MAVFNKINILPTDILNKVHDFGADALTVALTTNANAPVATNSILGNLTEIAYTNLSTRVIANNLVVQNTAIAELAADDLVLTASGAVATFRWVTIYNDTPSAPVNPLICYYDYGSDVTLANAETFTINFATNIFTLT